MYSAVIGGSLQRTARKLTWTLLWGLIGGIVFASMVGAAERNFNFRLRAEPETLDWNRAHTMIETYVLMNIMEGLVTFDSNLKVIPQLAQSWELSKDGKTYTFKLRPDVKWTDGAPLKARDFVYSWRRLLTPLTAASYAYLLFDVEGAESFHRGKLKDFSEVGIRAVDDLTFQVKLIRPVARWLDIPTFWVTFPMREDVVEKYGPSWETPGRMVTLGPYKIESHDLESKIVFSPNPFYYGTRGNLDHINGLIIKDDSVALKLYETGKLDFLTDISTVDLARLKGRPDLKIYPYLKTAYIGFAIDKFPMTNFHIRRAFAMAIDRSKIAEVLHGEQVIATSFLPEGMFAHSNHRGLHYDPIAARKELHFSGFDLTKPVQFELLLPNWDKDLTLAQYIQGEIKKNLGIELMLQPFDHKTFRAQLDLHACAVYLASWSADFPDPDGFLSVFLSSSGNNHSGWKNQHFDEMVSEARSILDANKREVLYHGAEKILLEEEAAILPLYYEPNLALVREQVSGLELNPLNYLLLRKVNLVGK